MDKKASISGTSLSPYLAFCSYKACIRSTPRWSRSHSRFHELLDQGKIAEIATQNHIYGSLKEKGADGIQDFVTTGLSPI